MAMISASAVAQSTSTVKAPPRSHESGAMKQARGLGRMAPRDTGSAHRMTEPPTKVQDSTTARTHPTSASASAKRKMHARHARNASMRHGSVGSVNRRLATAWTGVRNAQSLGDPGMLQTAVGNLRDTYRSEGITLPANWQLGEPIGQQVRRESFRHQGVGQRWDARHKPTATAHESPMAGHPTAVHPMMRDSSHRMMMRDSTAGRRMMMRDSTAGRRMMMRDSAMGMRRHRSDTMRTKHDTMPQKS